jgi:hypothetical protein
MATGTLEEERIGRVYLRSGTRGGSERTKNMGGSTGLKSGLTALAAELTFWATRSRCGLMRRMDIRRTADLLLPRQGTGVNGLGTVEGTCMLFL